METIKIFIVDDELDILSVLKQFLDGQGYNTFTCNNSSEAFKMAQKIIPDIFILDVMMPQKNGFELCELIRDNELLKNKYVFFLTALNDEDNYVKGLEKGADDYLIKPISLNVLKTKISKVVGKIFKNTDDNKLVFFDLEINVDEYHVKVKNNVIPLARKEFELLFLLASNQGKIFQREDILKRIWGSSVIVIERTVDVHVRKIRKKLKIDCIKTQKGIGYKFEYKI